MNNQPKFCERDIVELLCKRDKRGFDELYDRYAPMLYGMITNIIEDGAADEVLKEVFLNAWREIGRFELERKSLCIWMISITSEATKNYILSKGIPNQEDSQVTTKIINEHDKREIPQLGKVS